MLKEILIFTSVFWIIFWLILGLGILRICQFGPECATFGTATTALGHILAVRASFCFALIAWVGLIGRYDSVMYLLSSFQRLRNPGFQSYKFPFCGLGSVF